jgi:hypothetical protein
MVGVGADRIQLELTPVLQWTTVDAKTYLRRFSDWSRSCQAYPTYRSTERIWDLRPELEWWS